jgi:hypothetical protein
MSLPSYVPILAATTAAQCLVSLAMLSPAAIAPEIARDLGVAASRIGWWISLAYGGAMLTSLLGGDAVRRLGAARTTQAASADAAGGARALAASTDAIAAMQTVDLAALKTGSFAALNSAQVAGLRTDQVAPILKEGGAPAVLAALHKKAVDIAPAGKKQ